MAKLKVVNEGHGPSRQEFDTSAFTSAQDLVWTEPGSMVGIPSRRVDCGRLSAISHSMSDYLRGHRLFHRRHSPEIRRSDLSMDFKALVRHLQGDFPHLREREVLMVVKNSPIWDAFEWWSAACQGGMASMIKKMYTFDEEFDIKKIDDPRVHPNFSAMPEGSPVWDDFPRVIYHTCDQAAFLSTIGNWQRAHSWRLSAQNRACTQLLQFDAALESGNEKTSRNAGREANRPSLWYGDAHADRREALCHRWGHPLARLDFKHRPDLRLRHEVWRVFLSFINRAYATHRKAYQQVLKRHRNLDLLSKMTM